MEITPNAIKAYREALGMTPERLGAALGVAGRTVRRWESGDARPPHAIAVLLELSERSADARTALGVESQDATDATNRIF